jgi:uncharacterized protein YwgA
MSPIDRNRDAWVVAAAVALNQYGSWTGRVHIHKHLFITQVLGLAAPPFNFVLYDYGPYSFELDQTVTNLELFGRLTRYYPQPGYGPRFAPSIEGLKCLSSLGENELRTVWRVAGQLRDRRSQELELIATCLWFERKQGVSDVEEVVRKVAQAKPKYEDKIIRQRLDETRELVKSLAPSSASA